MKLEYCVICDYASVGPDGKMVIVGTFDRVFHGDGPALLPLLGVALRLRAEASDTDGRRHKIQLRIKSPDASTLAQLDAEVGLQPGLSADRVEENSISLPFMAQNMVFAQKGKYAFEVWLDNRLLSNTPLYVSSPPTQVPVAMPGRSS